MDAAKTAHFVDLSIADCACATALSSGEGALRTVKSRFAVKISFNGVTSASYRDRQYRPAAAPGGWRMFSGYVSRAKWRP
ncbi:hypothetical protein KCP73_00925 [Salmonella enterica subsp. enterica]|nr:hypothetical protein KCP73_00925 [Salmonella enterica subsp. enterica]